MSTTALPNRPIVFGEDEVEPAFLCVDILKRDEARRFRLTETPPTYHGAPVSMKAEWWHRAACLGMDTALFFKEGRPAKRVVQACQRCPVREACLAEALERDEDYKQAYGYFGGMEPLDRQRVRRGGDPARAKEKSTEIRARFLAEAGTTGETDSELIHRLAGEYGLWPSYLKKVVARHVA